MAPATEEQVPAAQAPPTENGAASQEDAQEEDALEVTPAYSSAIW
jgi:hypothetical protein